MTDVVITGATMSDDEGGGSAVSWGAILAGAVASAAMTILLITLGAALGLSSISPWPNSGVSVTTFGIGAGVFLIMIAMLASAVGGYISGRLRTSWVGVHGHETYFRDTAHGVLTWAAATVFSVAVFGAAATHIGAGAATGATQGAANAAGLAAANSNDSVVDNLLRADPAANRPPMDAGQRAEVGRLVAGALRPGADMSAADRTYLAQVIAARTGISQADAEKRVNDTINQARAAADTARKATAKFLMWLVASMFVGALAAALAATEGGRMRDSEWWNERG